MLQMIPDKQPVDKNRNKYNYTWQKKTMKKSTEDHTGKLINASKRNTDYTVNSFEYRH